MHSPRRPFVVALSAVAAAAVLGGCLSVELVALAAEPGRSVGAPQRVKLLPLGEFASVDGRPGNLEGVSAQTWRLTPEGAHELVAAFARRKVKMLVDYEHATLRAAATGQPNPAAAWIVSLVFVSGGDEPGLYADLEWTPTAAAMVGRNEYRYLSPVFGFDGDTGEVLSLLHVGLTNTPGLNTEHLPELQAQLSALAAAQTAALGTPPFSTPPETGTTPQEPPMKLLLAALGLSAVASEEAGLAALTALQGQVNAKDALIVELKSKQFDPAQHIPLTEHKKVADQLAALSVQTEATEHAALMTAALADARILPANADYWKAQPLVALKAFLKDAKPLSAALSGLQTGGQPPAGGSGHMAALSAEDKAVCEQLGLKPEDYLKTKAEAAA